MQNKFIKYSILFFLPLILGYTIMEKLTLELPSNFKANKTSILLNKDKFETMILGSSQMMVGLNAEWIDSPTISLASSSQHHDTDFILLKTLQPEFKNLKTVVLEVSYSHFEYPHNGTKFWKNPLYLKFFKANMFNRKTYYKDQLVFIANTPLFINDIYNYYIKNDLDYKINKYGFNTINYSGAFKELNYNEHDINLISKIDINTIENKQANTYTIKLFFEILNYLEKEKLNIIICKVPMYKTYLSARDKSISIRRDSVLKVVEKKYKNIKMLDLEEDTLNFKTHHYINHNHLNPDGAKIFTQKLNEVINNINH